MEQVPPAIGRARLDQDETGLRILIPAKWSWYTFIAEPVLGLFLGIVYMPRVWDSKAAVVVIGGILAVTIVRRWLWNIGGQEKVLVTADQLSVKYGIFGIGWTIRYKLSGISNFRYLPPCNTYHYHENRTLAFDYEFMPRRVGSYLSEAEVKELINAIQNSAETLFTSRTPREIVSSAPV
ncbi:MAG TPA: hypothetical protein VJQ59_16580 [Candidatus Sulfotelmatobacter sp.]|nr:hypothetical protein [Candidatus Sulfotelmatobacter sp.]